jgi:ankyrin repeat protein
LQGHTEKVKWLIKKGAYINTKNKCHKIPRGMELYGTVVPMYEETIKPKLYTALMVAKNIDTIKALIQAGADINVQASDGNTALMLYTKDNWFEGVEELISAGADANLTNKWFETALTIAKRNNLIIKLKNYLYKNTAWKLIPSILSTLFWPFKSEH